MYAVCGVVALCGGVVVRFGGIAVRFGSGPTGSVRMVLFGSAGFMIVFAEF